VILCVCSGVLPPGVVFITSMQFSAEGRRILLIFIIHSRSLAGDLVPGQLPSVNSQLIIGNGCLSVCLCVCDTDNSSYRCTITRWSRFILVI